VDIFFVAVEASNVGVFYGLNTTEGQREGRIGGNVHHFLSSPKVLALLPLLATPEKCLDIAFLCLPRWI
jgi:hypothetical protein